MVYILVENEKQLCFLLYSKKLFKGARAEQKRTKNRCKRIKVYSFNPSMGESKKGEKRQSDDSPLLNNSISSRLDSF